MLGCGLIQPDWPLPAAVRAVYSTRDGGVSAGRYSNFNLSGAVGDDADAIGENRLRFCMGLAGQPECVWLKQIHSDKVVAAHTCIQTGADVEADASWTDHSGVACVVMTADCVPVLLAADDGACVAAVHAGWRGLAAGVIAAAARIFVPGRYTAFLGPCISPEWYQVDVAVQKQLLATGANAAAFTVGSAGKVHVDLAAIARHQLEQADVRVVYQAGLCTYTEQRQFFSARRDGNASGRCACAIWKMPSGQQQVSRTVN